MRIIQAMSLMVFSFGIAIASKYWGFADWVEARPEIAFPMIVIGAVGVVLSFTKGR